VKVFDNCERVPQHEFGSATEFMLCWVKRLDIDCFTGIHESQRGVFFSRIESQVDYRESMIDDGGFQLREHMKSFGVRSLDAIRETARSKVFTREFSIGLCSSAKAAAV